MNTFSKTLAPSVRVSYMILPEKLLEEYVSRSDFYSNTVPNLVQYTLARFINKGYFERHLSRVRKYYHQQGEQLPRAEAVVDPHRHDCFSPFKYMCGAGIALKLVAAIDGGDYTMALEQFGDLAAIATVADNLIQSVKYQIENLTNFKVKKINIFVEGVRVID